MAPGQVPPPRPTRAMAKAMAEVAKTTVVYVGKIAPTLPDVSSNPGMHGLLLVAA